MSRELMPKSGIMMPHVVVTRDAAVVGVSTVDGVAGAIDLTDKYLQKSDASATYMTKAEGATKQYVTDAIDPVMEGALFKADPFVANDVPFRSEGANGVESVDMIKVTPENAIKIGSYASSVQGVEVHTAGRLQVVDLNDGGVETKYPIYSKRYRPEIEDLPFASIGSYVKDSKGRTIGVTRTGINSDIKQFTEKVTFQQPVTVADAVGDYDAVTLRQLRNSGGGSGGPTMNGISNFNIGDFRLIDSRAYIPSNDIPSDGQLLSRTDYPELWAYAQMITPISDADWLADPLKRSQYSLGDGSTTFRVPDKNGVQSGSLKGLFGRGSGDFTQKIHESAAPEITGAVSTGSSSNFARLFVANSASGSLYVTDTGLDLQLLQASTGAGTGSNRGLAVNFKASNSSAVYGRQNVSEIRPNSFVGVWVIRAKGGFVAANTSWSVINSDSVLPNTGTSINGGSIISEYKTGTDVEGYASFRMVGTVGSTYAARVTVFNKTSGANEAFDFGSDGNLNVPTNLIVRSGNVDAKGQLISREGKATFVGNNNNQSFIEFKNSANTAIYGRLYTERDGDVTISTSTAGTNLKHFQFLKDGRAVCPGGWSTDSDERIKDDISRIEKPLDKMKEIKGVSWKLKTSGDKVGYGFIAQDVEKIFPDAVKVTGDTELQDGSIVKDTKSVDTYGVAAALHHEAILELMKQVDELKKEVATLKAAK
ncbi:tailspike [Escherichia phage vB_EcoP_PAS59]|uniref:Tailspike n=1 Tax=Escherichia phage vB_EcoP_PAS59 TaxID=3053873 RepID=A0AA51VIP1_9CAUD|nr:tailspike [Escherichia phage vB_EcoP_PAS59]